MFNFKKKILNPVIQTFLGKISDALAEKETGERIEKLLAVKEEASAALSKIDRSESNKAFSATFIMIAGFGLAGFGLIALAPITAVATALASPFVLAGGALTAGAIAFGFKMRANTDRTNGDKNTLERKIDTEVYKLATAAPQEAVKSPRFLTALKAAFNPAADEDASFTKLGQRVQKTAAPAVLATPAA